MNLRNFLKLNNYYYDNIVIENLKTKRIFNGIPSNYILNKNVAASIFSFFENKLIIYID